MAQVFRTRINGALDTSNNVLDNLNKILNSCGAYITWDPFQGKWKGGVINVGSSVFSFDDSNIVSAISLGTSDFDQIYNRVNVQFPHKDLRDSIDTETFSIPDEDRYNGETDNTLNLNLELCNDPIQAQLVAAIALQQSRVDKVITFTADYTANGLLAGDIVDVTNSIYNWTNKLWRLVSIEEEDGQNGELYYNITAAEYDANVYSVSGLIREERNTETAILPSLTNNCVQEEDGNYIIKTVKDNKTFGGALLGSLAVRTLGNFIRSNLSLNNETGQAELELIPGSISVVPQLLITGPSSVCEGESFTLTISPQNTCVVDGAEIPYVITGVDENDIDVPLTGTVEVQNDVAQITITVTKDNATEGAETLVFSTSCNEKSVLIKDQYLAAPTYTLTASAAVVDECQDITWTFGASNVDDGREFTYAITGIDASDIESGSLTGTLATDWCNSNATVFLSFAADTDSGDETVVISISLDGTEVATNTITLTDGVEYTLSASPSSIVEGDQVTFTVDTSSMADGTDVPYVLYGSATSIVSSPSLTGNITINGNTGTLTVQTLDDSIDNSNRLLFLSVGPTPNYGSCTGTMSVVVADNDDADEECEYTSVPAVWCGKYDPVSGELKSMTVKKYVNVLTYPAIGTGVEVPTSISVSQGDPSTITVNSTITAYPGYSGSADDYYSGSASAGISGTLFHIITDFDNCSPLSPPTGTTKTFLGY